MTLVAYARVSTDDQDLGHSGSHESDYSLIGRLGERERRADLMRRAAAVTPSTTSIDPRLSATSGTVP